jgi:hypothetical protein
MKTYGDVKVFHLFLILASVVTADNFMALLFSSSVKAPQYQLDKMSGGQNSWSKCSVEEKNLLPLPGIEP